MPLMGWGSNLSVFIGRLVQMVIQHQIWGGGAHNLQTMGEGDASP